jgi:LacI family transcriptional regulator, gluconate utilization system Gnt-I transcriptional repressor
MQHLLDEGDLPHAVAFSNDYFAAGAILQAREHGTQIPTLLGVMGFGDMTIAGQIGISTLAVPRYGIGFATGTRVVARIAAQADSAAPQEPPSARRLPSDSVALQLIKRNSTRLTKA